MPKSAFVHHEEHEIVQGSALAQDQFDGYSTRMTGPSSSSFASLMLLPSFVGTSAFSLLQKQIKRQECDFANGKERLHTERLHPRLAAQFRR